MKDTDKKMGPIYIAGPMTGFPDHNFPAFNAMADKLRSEGWVVVNPAEINAAYGPEYDIKYRCTWMRNDIQALLTCSHIMLLEGFEYSTGARLEAQVAHACGIERRNGY